MNRSKLNFIVDALAFACFSALAVTGVLMRYTLPPGSGGWATVWGMNRHAWGDVHFWVSVAFFAVLLLHLVLHFRWIICMARGKPPEGSWRRLVLGLMGLVVLLGLLLAPLFAPVAVREGDGIRHGRGGGGAREGQRTGSGRADREGFPEGVLRVRD